MTVKLGLERGFLRILEDIPGTRMMDRGGTIRYNLEEGLTDVLVENGSSYPLNSLKSLGWIQKLDERFDRRREARDVLRIFVHIDLWETETSGLEGME